MAVLNYYKMRDDVQDPVFATEGAACFDIYSNFEDSNCGYINFYPGKIILVPTGLIFDIPTGYSVRLHPRSGLAFKRGLTLINAEGVIDSDYVDEVKVAMVNHGNHTIELQHNTRICQAELVKNLECSLIETPIAPLSKTDRQGGFGSTGVK